MKKNFFTLITFFVCIIKISSSECNFSFLPELFDSSSNSIPLLFDLKGISQKLNLSYNAAKKRYEHDKDISLKKANKKSKIQAEIDVKKETVRSIELDISSLKNIMLKSYLPFFLFLL